MLAVLLKLRCDEKNGRGEMLPHHFQDEPRHLFCRPQRNDVDRSGEVKLSLKTRRGKEKAEPGIKQRRVVPTEQDTLGRGIQPSQSAVSLISERNSSCQLRFVAAAAILCEIKRKHLQTEHLELISFVCSRLPTRLRAQINLLQTLI